MIFLCELKREMLLNIKGHLPKGTNKGREELGLMSLSEELLFASFVSHKIEFHPQVWN